ncbi:unnamed protein product [marine sediment metagenome]|uniref:Uncharacterized protein n=1 Tax=marine sediment metagenome TaxID=412755 RepID=X1CWF4_9ZZZZ
MQGRGSYRREKEFGEIIKTTKLYADNKTTVPGEVINLLNLEPGESKIVWIKEGKRIYVTGSEIRFES